MRRTFVAGAIALALCACPSLAAAQGPPPDSQFQKVTIDQRPGEPIDLAVLPDQRVLHTERSGEVWLHNPANGLKTLAAKVNVYSHGEEGLQSIALDPNFASNKWIYLYYSPPLDTPLDDPATPTVNEGDAPGFGTPADFAKFKGYIQLSRFKWTGSTIDLGAEQKILQVPVDRGLCCHVGGDIVFDKAGNLLLSTGDDTNPFESDGKVKVTYVLGHDQHGHPLTTAFGCTGTITTSVPSGHDPATDNLRAVFDAEYTDAGSGNLPPLSGTDEVVLNPAG